VKIPENWKNCMEKSTMKQTFKLQSLLKILVKNNDKKIEIRIL